MSLIHDHLNGWTPFFAQTAQQLGTALDAQQHAVMDLHAHEVGGQLRFTGIHAASPSGGWWYFGQTPQDVGARLTEHGAVPVSLSAYATPAGTRFAVSMQRLAQPYWWYFGLTADELGRKFGEHGARPVDITAYATPAGLRFASVMVPSQAGYWWWFGLTPQALSVHLTQTQGRLHSLRAYPVDGGWRYVAVVYPNAPRMASGWWFGQTEADVGRLTRETGMFPIGVAPEPGGDRVSCVLLQRAWPTQNQAVHDQVSQQLGQRHTGGWHGFYLRRVGGPVIHAYNHEAIFDPCSTLKSLVHAHALRALQLGTQVNGQVVTEDTVIEVPAGQATECPFVNHSGTPETLPRALRDALSSAMQNSSNRPPEAMRQFFGPEAVAQTALALGMTQSRHLGPTGCMSNHATLVDFGQLYERCSNGSFLDAAHWQRFRQLALDGPIDGLEAAVRELVAELGLSASHVTEFMRHVQCVHKGGNGSDGTVEKLSVVGHVALPFWAGRRRQLRHYVYGVCLDAVPAGKLIDRPVLNETASTLLRGEVRACLRSMPDRV